MRRLPVTRSATLGFFVGVLQPADRFNARPVVAQPRRRGRDASRRALEQLYAEPALDRGDMLRDAGLRRVLARRRARERAFLARSDYGANLPQRNVDHATPSSIKLMLQSKIYYFIRWLGKA